MRNILNRLLAFLRSEAVTIGLSPKALAPAIGVLIIVGLTRAGLPVPTIATSLGVSVSVVNGAIALIGATVAGYLLGPGNVVRPAPELTEGSDARLSPTAKANIPSAPAKGGAR